MHVYLDESGNAAPLGRLNKENPKRIKKVSGHNSRQSDLLQLADVVVGSVFRAKERSVFRAKERGDSRCLSVIESRMRWHRFGEEKESRDR